jgi:hypothetical protein
MDAKQAIERLYEDESVSGALEDTAAAPLMRWAEAQLTRMVATTPDEPRFEQDFAALRKLIKRIGRYIDRRTEWTEGEQAAELEVIKADAHWLKAPLSVATPADYLSIPAVEVVHKLIGVAPAESAPTPDAPPAEAVTPAPAVPVVAEDAAPADSGETAPPDQPTPAEGLSGLIQRLFQSPKSPTQE